MKKASKRAVVKKVGSASETARLKKELRALRAKHAKAQNALDALEAERDEALEQQTATSEVLRTIASSPAEADRALDTIVRVAARLHGAPNVSIHRVEGNLLRFAAAVSSASGTIHSARASFTVVPITKACGPYLLAAPTTELVS